LETISVAEDVRKKIESEGEHIWRFNDFSDMPTMAVAQALSRLSRKGVIQRLGKGLYYRPRQTVFGKSRPSSSQLRSLQIERKGIFPAGNSAANLLGFSTQNSAKIEVATNGLSLSRLIVGKETVIHTRRPESWQELSCQDAALLDFLRKRGETSELSEEETVNKLLKYFQEPGQFERILQVIESEPPRVKAILGAIGQELKFAETQLFNLRKSLNPLSRFDFGNLSKLQYAKQWQAKECKSREII
jgi:hypothetical protein